MHNPLLSVRWTLVCALGALMLHTSGPVIAQTRASSELPGPIAPLQPAFTGCTVQVFPPVNPDFEQQVVELVNDHRASIGRPPLKRVSLLDETARYHARDMKEDDYFNHDTYDRVNGALQRVCNRSERVGSHYTNWNRLGENIAAGYTTPQAVMQGWLQSEGHRRNIESPNFWEIGVGYDDEGGSWGRYWVQNFGQRLNVYPLVINREYSRTASPQVTIYIYGNWTQVRLRNDGGAWSAWLPFANTLSWSLNPVAGMREVCAEFTNGAQTFSACDTILLTTSAPKLVVSPTTLTFVRDLATGDLYPQTPISVRLSSSDESVRLNWSATAGQPWLTVNPSSGSTPATAQVSLVPEALPDALGSYEGIITFRTEHGAEPVTVTLQVVNGLPFKAYVPVVRR